MKNDTAQLEQSEAQRIFLGGRVLIEKAVFNQC